MQTIKENSISRLNSLLSYFVENANYLFVFEIINLVNRYLQGGNKSFITFYNIIIINLLSSSK